MIEPLRIVDHADERLLRGDVAEQAVDRKADEEPIGSVAAVEPEGNAQRFALRTGQAVQPVRKGHAQLLEPGIRELHLRLDAVRPGDATSGCTLHKMIEKRRLPDAGLTVEHENVTLARANIGKEAVENVDLAVPTAKLEPVPRRLTTASVIPSIARSLSARSSTDRGLSFVTISTVLPLILMWLLRERRSPVVGDSRDVLRMARKRRCAAVQRRM